MGLFSSKIDHQYAVRAAAKTQPAPAMPALSILSPWSPQDSVVTWAIDEALGGLSQAAVPMTREIALRIPGVKRAHGIACSTFAGIPFFQMEGDTRTTDQPKWLTNSASGVAPYHRAYGMASDWFFNGWACLGFTADMTDALHIPFGMWKIDEHGFIVVPDDYADRVPVEYTAHLIAIPLGFGENGLLNDGIDTLKQARKIEASYQDRLDNPVPLTILGLPRDVWESWTPEERQSYRDQWVQGRKSANGATAMKIAEFPVDMPGQVSVDLYESGRNAVRLDIANHTATPASLLEGVRQGGSGGGTEISYSGVANGATRGEFWDFGLPKRMTSAFEARLSLDDVVPSGMSIRGDLTSLLAAPTPNTNPTSED